MKSGEANAGVGVGEAGVQGASGLERRAKVEEVAGGTGAKGA